eukprot:scaffold32177_cov90-Skeletonema_marinoi.AAC.2
MIIRDGQIYAEETEFFTTDADAEQVYPQLSDCLYYTSSSEDCSKKKDVCGAKRRTCVVQRACAWTVLGEEASEEDELSPMFSLVRCNYLIKNNHNKKEAYSIH